MTDNNIELLNALNSVLALVLTPECYATDKAFQYGLLQGINAEGFTDDDVEDLMEFGLHMLEALGVDYGESVEQDKLLTKIGY